MIDKNCAVIGYASGKNEHSFMQLVDNGMYAMTSIIGNDVYPVVFGSRILGNGALKGGMPVYKYIANRFLTLTQNILLGQKLSEYHTGYRAFSKEVLQAVKLEACDDDFIFDNEMVSQVFYKGYQIGEVTCPTKYFEEASSINFSRSMKYGLGCLKVSVIYRLCKWGLMKSKLYYLQLSSPLCILSGRNNETTPFHIFSASAVLISFCKSLVSSSALNSP